MKEAEMVVIAGFLLRAVAIAKRIQNSAGKQLKDFLPALENDDEILQLSRDVEEFAT
jgi:hypothetical protein